MLLFAIDLIVFLSLAAQFAIAGYFLYLVYWLIELPAADTVPPPLPAELPHVLVQIPVYNEPLVVERALVAAAALDWPRDRLTIQLLDDSTDITPDIAVHAVARLRRDGVEAASRRARWRPASPSRTRPTSRFSTPTSCRLPTGCRAP